jgi:hypothetical protein
MGWQDTKQGDPSSERTGVARNHQPEAPVYYMEGPTRDPDPG